MRPKGVIDGKQVNIPVLCVWSDAGVEKGSCAGCWISQYKPVGLSLWKIRDSLRLRGDVVDFGPEGSNPMLTRKAAKR